MHFSERELIRQISNGIEGDLTQEETAELDALLSANPEARKIYLNFVQMHSLLETFPPEENSLPITPAFEGGNLIRLTKSSIAISLAVAAMIVILATAATFFNGAAGPNTIATLILAEECEWKSASPLAEGQRLSAGKIHLLRGTAVIRFDNGAEMAISTNSNVSLLSAESASLKSGEVIVRAEEGSEGFRLDSPGGKMTDLGTEFAVRVRPTGETELHVHEGEVATAKSIVTAGQAVRLEKTGSSELAIDAPRFGEAIQKANPKERRDLMTTYEGFFTDPGVYPPTILNTGKGWNGSWRLRTPAEFGENRADTFPDMKIGYGELNVVWPIRGGQKGMLELPPGRNIRTRQLLNPIDLSKKGITYFSFLAGEVRSSKEKQETTHSDIPAHRSDFRITLRSSDDYFGEALSAGWSRNRQARIQSSPGAVFRSIRIIPEDETIFCVGKIIHSKHQNDEVQFRFYRNSDTLHFAEPAEWDIETKGLDLSAKLDLLLITSLGQSTRYVDEIRIGPTWRSVTPINNEISKD